MRGATRTIELQHDHDQKHCGESQDTERPGPRQRCRILGASAGVGLSLVDQRRQREVRRVDGLAVDPLRPDGSPAASSASARRVASRKDATLVGHTPQRRILRRRPRRGGSGQVESPVEPVDRRLELCVRTTGGDCPQLELTLLGGRRLEVGEEELLHALVVRRMLQPDDRDRRDDEHRRRCETRCQRPAEQPRATAPHAT